MFGNSDNSYIPMFYTNDAPYLHLQSDIFKLNRKYFQEINYKKIFEWLVYNGRSFDNSTFLSRIKCLEPGSIFILDRNREKLIHGKVFSYKNKSTSIESIATKVSESLRKAINLRIASTTKNVSFGLSGGLDSRILLSLIEPQNLKKVRSHTIGSKTSFDSFHDLSPKGILAYFHKILQKLLVTIYFAIHNILSYTTGTRSFLHPGPVAPED